MKINIYTIFDSVSKTYNKPFYQSNDDTACRAFTNAINDSESQLSLNPSDFTLYYLAEFDDESGEIHVAKQSKIAHGPEVVKYHETHSKKGDIPKIPEFDGTN